MMIKETATTCAPGESSPLDGMYTMTAKGNGRGRGGEEEEKKGRGREGGKREGEGKGKRIREGGRDNTHI